MAQEITMEYVNASGKPLDLEALKASSKRRAVSRASNTSYHKGWLATGFPPQQIEDGRLAHASLVAKAESTGRSMLPWDEARFMRDTRPTKVRAKPYDTRAAAEEAVALAERMGWKGCTWSEITKGQL